MNCSSPLMLRYLAKELDFPGRLVGISKISEWQKRDLRINSACSLSCTHATSHGASRQRFVRVRKRSSNISNTRRCVSSDIETLRSRVKKRGAAEFF